jgi:putative transposase
MTRPLRIEFPNAVYHVLNRGNARASIFDDDGDRILFLTIFTQVVKRYNWVCHAYCLMDNHYHLLVETPDGNLSVGMRQLNGNFTQAFNRKHHRDGHLFRGRFKSILVEKENHLLELCRYIVLNPVRAGMVKTPEEYQWSSYLSTLGKHPMPEYLKNEWILSNFSSYLLQARNLYRIFVDEGIGDKECPWEKITGQVVLGSKTFLEYIKHIFSERETVGEIPKIQRFVGRPLLSEFFPTEGPLIKEERNQLIRLAHIKHGYTLKEISAVLNLHYTTVSKVINSTP